MPKKSSGRKKGIQRGIQRHRVGNKDTADGDDDVENETESPKSRYLSRSQFSSFGEKCFHVTLAACEKLHLIGFKRAQTGEYVPINRKAHIWHTLAVLCCMSLCLQRTWVTVRYLLYKELRLESFICISISMIYDVGLLLGLPVVMRSKETMDLLNSWLLTSASLKNIDPGSRFRPLDNMSACLKVTSAFLVHQGLAVWIAIVSMIMGDLPFFLCPMAERFGLLPEGYLPSWAWKIMFSPLEWFITLPLMLMSSLGDCCMFMGNGALDVYLQRLRKIKVHCMESRRQVEQIYVQLELLNRITQVWNRSFFPLWLFGLASAVIMAGFITIRYAADLPLICYIFFPYIALTLMTLIFWQSFDMLSVIRASEATLGELWQHQAPYFQGLTRANRVELMKRSKAMRPLVFSVADSEFNINLPINTWDEILNQILFLLAL